MDRIRVGFVGAGYAASFHEQSLRQVTLPGVEPVGVYSRTASRAQSFAQARNLRVFSGLEELLEAVDVVHVCVPPALHETVTIRALEHNVHAVVEKPFTGYFGDPGSRDRPEVFAHMRTEVASSARRMLDAERSSRGRIYYAENWVFAPVVRKEEEIIRATGAQILWMLAQEAHSGSHAPSYGIWRESGGGSVMGKGAHPLSAVLHLKRVEGVTRSGQPIRPRSVSARVHELTRLPGYVSMGYLRSDYRDVEDFGAVHLVFDDGTVADVFASEIVMGGVDAWIEVFANNHRTRCTISPTNGLHTFNPRDEQLKDVYVTEKISTKQGWSHPSADENWSNGYVHEVDHFYRCMRDDVPSHSGAELGADTCAVIYAAYASASQGGREVSVQEAP